MTPFFHLLLELNLWHPFLYFKIVKIHFHGIPLWPILVCKIPEFWRWKLWDQKFGPGKIQETHTLRKVKNQVLLFLSSWEPNLSDLMVYECKNSMLSVWVKHQIVDVNIQDQKLCGMRRIPSVFKILFFPILW